MFFISREVAINLFIEGVRVMQRTEIKRGMVLLLLLLVLISWELKYLEVQLFTHP